MPKTHKKTNFATLCLGLISAILIIGKFNTPIYAQTGNATLSFSPSSGSYAVGQTVSVNVLLNTGGANTTSTDVDITYSPTTLRLDDIVPGTLYSQYAGESINNTTGKASLGGLSTTLFKGTGTFATLKFTTLKSGSGTVSFDFTQGSTTDSNVNDFDNQIDALKSVTNATYTVTGSSSTSATSTPSPGTSSTGSGTPFPIPDTGNTQPFVILLSGAALLIGFGFAISKKH